MVALIFFVGLSTACNKYAHETIDRTIIGQLVTVTQEGDYSILDFRDGNSILVSNSSLSHWKIEPIIAGAGTWVFDLHSVKTETSIYYNIVDINSNVPLGGPTTTENSN